MFFVITFEPNKIQTRLTPHNNLLNVSFVNDIHAVGEKRSGLNNRFLRERGMGSTLKMEYVPGFSLHFPKNSGMATLGLKEMRKLF